MKILTVIGARPQFIKAAVVSRALHRLYGVEELTVHTGQHYDEKLSEIFFRELALSTPKYNLRVGSDPHAVQIARMMEALDEVVYKEAPDCVLVYGDTNSTLAGALVSSKRNIPLAHVEAGLRSFNRLMPEEMNRVLADHIASQLFAPTEAAVRNLAHEGVTGTAVHLVGDVMYDSALFFAERAQRSSRIHERLSLDSGSYVLATIHRQENTDDTFRLRNIAEALLKVAARRTVVLPLHPRTQQAFSRLGLLNQLQNRLRVIDPVGYLDMVMLERRAALIVTDSGGVQKEAYFYRVPCVTVRDETEWVELVELGWNRLVTPQDKEVLAGVIEGCIGCGGKEGEHPYGNGASGEQIADLLISGGSV